MLRRIINEKLITRATSMFHSSQYQCPHPIIPSCLTTTTSHHRMKSTSSPPQQNPSSDTLIITDACKRRLQAILKGDSFLRVSIDGGGCSGFQYKFEVDTKLEVDDIILNCSETDSSSSARVVIDKTSLDIVRGSTLDYETELIRSAFRIINNPQAEQGCSCGASFNMKLT